MLKEKKKEIEAIKGEVQKNQALKAQYEEKLQGILDYISKLTVAIEETRDKLAFAQKELDQKEAELKKTYDTFALRLRYMYMNDFTSPLTVILGSDSFSDAIVLGEYLSKMAEHDSEQIDDITAKRDQVIILRDGINRSLEDLSVLMEEQEEARLTATQLVMETNKELELVQAQQQVKESEYETLYKNYQDAQSEIDRLSKSYNDREYVGGNFAWPVPYSGHVSSGYGPRILYGRNNFHTGIDIAGGGIYGKDVIASNEGTVVRVVYGSTGYGLYVLIDHGGGWMTLYAHLSAIHVSEGESVEKKQTIGSVGSTGNSTGPHLHYEIRKKGVAIDPLGSDLPEL